MTVIAIPSDTLFLVFFISAVALGTSMVLAYALYRRWYNRKIAVQRWDETLPHEFESRNFHAQVGWLQMLEIVLTAPISDSMSKVLVFNIHLTRWLASFVGLFAVLALVWKYVPQFSALVGHFGITLE